MLQQFPPDMRLLLLAFLFYEGLIALCHVITGVRLGSRGHDGRSPRGCLFPAWILFPLMISKHVCWFAGETVEEQRKKMQNINITQPSTNVIVQPPKVSV